MSLALVIKQRGSTYAAAQKKYKESVIAVNTQMTGVLSSQLPVIAVIPKDWDKYQSTYEQAQTDALGWVNTVMARLLGVPQEVQTYNDDVVATLQDAIVQADALAKNPSNRAARSALEADLKAVLGTLNLVTVFISGAVKNIQQFKNKLPDLATQLQAIADLATKDAGADQGQIDKLNKDVAAWQAEVNTLVGAIVGLGLADAAAIGLATFITIAAWPEGAVVWLFAAPVIAIATYYITIDGIKISQLKAQMDGAANQMNKLNASVGVLHLLSQKFTDLATKTVAIEGDLQAVLAAWQAFEGDIKGAVQQIQLAISNESSGDFAKIKTELNEALTEWKGVYKQAGGLVLNLVVKQGVQLTVGMTPAQVKAASDNAQSVDIIQYYNQIAA